MKGKYPLDAVHKLRQRAVDERVREVAERVRRAERAAAAAQAARRARQEEQERIRGTASEERARLEGGGARVADLLRESEWSRGAEQRAAELAEREARALEAARTQKAEEELARRRLAQADAGAKAVDEHRARWKKERDDRIEKEEEEVAGEAWLSGRLRGGTRPGGRT